MKKTIYFLIVMLFFSSYVFADTITAPGDVSLECARRQSKESTSLTVSWTSETAGKEITVQAAVGSGTPVANAKLYIKGGDLSTYTLLITGSTGGGTKIIEDSASASGSIEDIYLKLDASSVSAGASGLNNPWTYILTYTIQ